MRIPWLVPLGFLAACARSGPLPGDSVSADGGVTLSPPKSGTSPEAPLGAIEGKLFPPELVMEHQAALGITAGQKDAILKEVDRGQSEMAHLQWELQGEKEKLVNVLDNAKVDEAKVTAQATRVMENENRVKSSHLLMLVRVKNLLTPEQQTLLRPPVPNGKLGKHD